MSVIILTVIRDTGYSLLDKLLYTAHIGSIEYRVPMFSVAHSIEYPASSIQYPESSIQSPASSIFLLNTADFSTVESPLIILTVLIT